jgi:hypothetical protein
MLDTDNQKSYRMNPISPNRLDTLFLAVNVAQTSKGVNHELRYNMSRPFFVYAAANATYT